jgi:hypothetical protein
MPPNLVSSERDLGLMMIDNSALWLSSRCRNILGQMEVLVCCLWNASSEGPENQGRPPILKTASSPPKHRCDEGAALG